MREEGWWRFERESELKAWAREPTKVMVGVWERGFEDLEVFWRRGRRRRERTALER